MGDYYWWQGGALWGTMIDYWHFTGDATYNDIIKDALLFQVGPKLNYMPPNWTASMGNDDQGAETPCKWRPLATTPSPSLPSL